MKITKRTTKGRKGGYAKKTTAKTNSGKKVTYRKAKIPRRG